MQIEPIHKSDSKQPFPGLTSIPGPKPRPWFRASTNSWYVCLDGRQVALGTDEAEAHERFQQILEHRGATGRLAGATATRLRLGRRFVYFIRDCETGNIKIGMSANPEKRLAELQIAHHGTLKLLASAPGGRQQETKLKRWFRASRIRGEWFRETPELMAVIDSVQRFPLLPIDILEESQSSESPAP